MKYLVGLLLLVFVSFNLFSQNREDLRIQQKRIEGQINYLGNLLKISGKDVRQNLNKLSLIDKQIVNQETLIKNLNLQNVKTREQINFHLEEKNKLEERFSTLKEEYAVVLMSYAKTRGAYNDWMFILAAENLNNIYKRYVYLSQYGDYRKSQASEIRQMADRIQIVIDSVEIEKLEQEKLLNRESDELGGLNELKSQRLVLLNEIKKKQTELLEKLQVIEAKEKSVKAEVVKYIKQDRVARNNKEAVVKSTNSSNKNEILNRVFEATKGKLSWPVKKGVIVKRFGVYHPANMREITLRNDGVDIQTSKGADVISVFKGNVVKIVSVPGLNKAVLIQHGDYYVLYSNLKYLTIKLGSKVEMGQKLGKVYGESTEDNTAIIKFQVWKNQEKLNPEKWLRTGRTF